MPLKIILTSSFIICALISSAQLNNISNDEIFETIKFNQVTLGEIMRSSGDVTMMRNLFGNSMQSRPNDTAPYLAKFIWNNKLSFGFEDESDKGDDFFLTYINVKSSEVIVEVQGISLKIGDSKNKLSNFEFNTNFKGYVFTDQVTGSISLNFRIDESTNKISEIGFIAY